MKQTEQNFLKALQSKAKSQASMETSSPLPQWVRPMVAEVGMHYWIVLLIFSLFISFFVSIWFFPGVYRAETGGF